MKRDGGDCWRRWRTKAGGRKMKYLKQGMGRVCSITLSANKEEKDPAAQRKRERKIRLHRERERSQLQAFNNDYESTIVLTFDEDPAIADVRYAFEQAWADASAERNLNQLETLSKKLKAKTLRNEAPQQSIAATRLLAHEGLNAEQLARDLKSFELKVIILTLQVFRFLVFRFVKGSFKLDWGLQRPQGFIDRSSA
ncbi:uncharacterized protein LOC112180068 isoform X3 [Rosa chinensis]|uniref:uncharacterized protein LOC112180068 isoform X3 n=1 Tax=Rosa chinensis TaxID=74649 RepID=UPI001AD8CE21|nr:uncharacterized protein LOC112180068 isoform X3 [Rosa chinensis]